MTEQKVKAQAELAKEILTFSILQRGDNSNTDFQFLVKSLQLATSCYR